VNLVESTVHWKAGQWAALTVERLDDQTAANLAGSKAEPWVGWLVAWKVVHWAANSVGQSADLRAAPRADSMVVR